MELCAAAFTAEVLFLEGFFLDDVFPTDIDALRIEGSEEFAFTFGFAFHRRPL